MQYLAYPAYNPAKSAWLSKIPEGWAESKFAYVKKVLTDYTANGSFADLKLNVIYKYSEDYARLVRLTDLRTGLKNDGIWVDEDAYRFLSKSALFGGEFLLANVGAHAGLFCQMPYINTPATLAPNMFMAKFEADKVSEEFMAYVGESDYVVKQLRLKATSSSAQPKLNKDDFKSVVFTYPDLRQQQKIAAFLDYKTQQIDQLIEKKKALIEKFNEQRIAVITQAVTKGLDKKVKMKPSGVNWLGDVPEHWEVKRLRFCIVSNPVKSEIRDLDGEDLVSFVPMEAVKEDGGMDLSQTRILDDVYSGYTYFKENDVVVAKITPCFENGKGSIAQGLENGIGFGTTEFHVLRGLETMDEEYLFYITISYSFRKNGEAVMLGAGGHKRIPEDYVKDYRQGVPDKEEQKEIVKYIKSMLAQIDSMFEVSKQVIAKYEEYRSAIITDAVTGKIDVRNVEWNKEAS